MTLPSRIDQVLDLAREAMAILNEERAGNYSAPRRWTYFDRVNRLRWDLAGDQAEATRQARVDLAGAALAVAGQAPHSRACGWQWHPHGVSCSADCPTCHPLDTGPATADPDNGAGPAPEARPC